MASSSKGRGKKLLDRALDALRNAGFDSANATGYVSWMRQYILFHNKRHPQEMGMPEVDAFLASNAFEGMDGASNADYSSPTRQRGKPRRFLRLRFRLQCAALWVT